MDQTSCSTPSGRTLHCALELSKNSWLLAIQFPDRTQASLYPIEGGNTEKLMAKLTAAQDCWAKVSGAVPAITVCYEVGYDAFWLARFLKARSIECLVIDPGSLQVNRRGRPVKTDRVDVKVLLRTLIAWVSGTFGRSCAFPASRKRICGARTASVAGWSGNGLRTSTGSKDYCSPKAFGASTSNPSTRLWQSIDS